jgi:hypothetical protein
MADPRAAVSFEGVDAEFATFKIDNSTITYSATATNGSSVVGKAVALSAAKTVKLAADGDAVVGKLIAVESDQYCTVQYEGYMTLPGGNGASLTLGKKIVGAVDGSSNPGFIREVNTGTAAELGKARGFIVDAGTTTAVVVNLE